MLRFQVISPPTEDGITVHRLDESGKPVTSLNGSRMKGDTPGSLVDRILEES